MSTLPGQTPDTVTLPLMAWESVLARLNLLEQAVGGLTVGTELTPLTADSSITDFAAGLVRPNLQLYSEAGNDCAVPTNVKIEQLTARAELAAALQSVAQPYIQAFESILGGRGETVKRLPERPADTRTSYNGYNSQHGKTLDWREVLPTRPSDAIRYSIKYLPAQSKIQGSQPELLSFSVNLPLAHTSITGHTPKSQTLECTVKDGELAHISLTEKSTSMEDGAQRHWNNITTLTLRQHTMSYGQSLRVRDNGADVEKSSVWASYNEQQQLIISPAKPELALTPQGFVKLTADTLGRIPTL